MKKSRQWYVSLTLSMITVVLMLSGTLLPIYAADEVRLYVHTVAAWEYDFNNATQTYPGTYTELSFDGWTLVKAMGTSITGAIYFDSALGTQQASLNLNNEYQNFFKTDFTAYYNPPYNLPHPQRKLDISVVHEDAGKQTNNWITKVYATNNNDTFPQMVWYQVIIPSQWVSGASSITYYVDGVEQTAAPRLGNWTLMEGYSWQLGYHTSMVVPSLAPSQTANFTIVVDLKTNPESPGWTPYSTLTSLTTLASGTTKVNLIPDLPFDDLGTIRSQLDYESGQPQIDASYASVVEQTYKIPISYVVESGVKFPLPASEPSVVDMMGSPTQPRVNQLVIVQSEISNVDTVSHTFTFIVQIKDPVGSVVSLSFITGSINVGQTINPGVSWIPREIGEYTIEIFVWKSFIEPLPLSEQVYKTVIVE
ncbi:MAG: hypothetical protein ACE5GD_00495 [Candidatus Geothermarchaeales archaeon]